MKKVIYIFIVMFLLNSCDVLEQVLQTTSNSGAGLTTVEMIDGLKSALNVGTENSVNILGKDGGFLNDNSVRIPFPQEIIKVKEKLEAVGLSDLVEKFEKELNTGASYAVKEALPIFKQAITNMTIADAKNILLGEKNAATSYFRSKTSTKLYDTFKPKVTEVLDKYGINKAYTSMMNAYNKIPFVTEQNTDLPDYVTNKAMDGLFLKMTNEEAKIRDNINARVNDILIKVFAWADSQK